MKQEAWPFKLILGLTLLLGGIGFSQELEASDRSPAGGSDTTQQQRISTQFGSGVNLITQGTATTSRSNIFNMLLGSTAGTPNWPAYPRLWYEEFDLTTHTSNTYWHPKIAALNGGIEIEYKYGKKTTLVMMTSAAAPTGTPPPPQNRTIMEPDKYRVVRWDPVRRRNFPLLRPGVPMVGFCSYELSLVTSRGMSGGLEFVGIGSKYENIRAHGVTYTIFSKFFQIPADMAVTDIMNVYCNSAFQKIIRIQAEQNFIPVIIEQTIANNPQSTCAPTPHDGPEGDVACRDWHNGFDRLRKHVTVARCELQKTGVSLCVLKAKENRRCPLYKDRAGRVYTKVSRFGLQNLTKSTLAFQCDEGSTCTMTKEPQTWGIFTRLGDSFCKRASTIAKAR